MSGTYVTYRQASTMVKQQIRSIRSPVRLVQTECNSSHSRSQSQSQSQWNLPKLFILFLLIIIYQDHSHQRPCINFVTGHSVIVIPPPRVIEVPTLQFELRTPHTSSSGLNGTQMYFHPSFAGGALPLATRTDGLLEINLMLPHKDDDITGCSGPWRTANEFNQTFENSFVLLMVGACSSINTLSVAANTGALGVLVYGCPPTKPYYCESRVVIAFSLVAVPTPLPPTISINSADGQKLVQFLKSNLNSTTAPPTDTLIVLIRGPGSCAPEERAALIAIANQTIMGEFVGGAAVSLPPWTVPRFQDPAIDPCLDIAVGIWCEMGHIVMIDVYATDWATLNGIPKEFGDLTHLNYLSVVQNQWAGAIPPEWCQLTELQVFRFHQVGSGLTSFPDCIGASWTQMKKIQFDGNSFTALPDSFSQLTNLQIIHAASNAIQFVPSLVNLTKLSIANFVSNAIHELPAFAPASASLTQIGFSANQINVPIPVDAFDGMSALQIIDLNTNRITGPLPNLIGCTNLLIVDFSGQRNLTTNEGGFNSSMPFSWRLLNVQELYLQENALISPIYSSAMFSLQRIDLSHNYITNAVPGNPNNVDPSALLDTVFGPSMISMRLSYNQVSGAFTRGSAVLTSNFLTEIYLDHNQLTNFFQTFFTSNTVFTAIDVSYNNISAAFPPDSPTSKLVYLNVRGNPGLKVATLPSWVVIGSTLTQELGASYGCVNLGATTSPALDFRVDPGFWGYRHCQCAPGTFGRPPLCHSVPGAAVLNPYHVITSSEVGDDFSDLVASVRGVGSQLTAPSTSNYSRSFSDSMYGEDRLTLGMSTVWVVDVSSLFMDDPEAYANEDLQPPVPIELYTINVTSESPSSLWTPVRMITVRLHVSATQFNTFENVISIYEGSSDLKGTRVFTMRGTDTKSMIRATVFTTSPEYLRENNASIAQINDARLYEIQVFSPMASVQFTSRDTSGLHFYATYSYDFSCPDGYFYNRDATPNQCHLNYEIYHVGLPIRSAVFVVSSLTVIFILVLVVILVINWDSPVFRAASRIFVAVNLVLLLLMGLGSFVYAAIPHDHDSVGSAICIGRAWLTCLPLTGILGILLAKANRLSTIFGATTLQVKKITDVDIGKTVLLVCSVQIILLGIFSGLPLSRAQLAVGQGNLSDRLVYSCSQETGFIPWMWVEIAFIACLMFPAVYLGYKTRNVPSQYNESSHIQNAIILLIFFGIIIVPLDIFIQDSPEAAVLIQGLGQAFMCSMMTAILFGPKLYYLTLFVKRPVKDQESPSTAESTPNAQPPPQQQANGNGVAHAHAVRSPHHQVHPPRVSPKAPPPQQFHPPSMISQDLSEAPSMNSQDIGQVPAYILPAAYLTSIAGEAAAQPESSVMMNSPNGSPTRCIPPRMNGSESCIIPAHFPTPSSFSTPQRALQHPTPSAVDQRGLDAADGHGNVSSQETTPQLNTNDQELTTRNMLIQQHLSAIANTPVNTSTSTSGTHTTGTDGSLEKALGEIGNATHINSCISSHSNPLPSSTPTPTALISSGDAPSSHSPHDAPSATVSSERDTSIHIVIRGPIDTADGEEGDTHAVSVDRINIEPRN